MKVGPPLQYNLYEDGLITSNDRQWTQHMQITRICINITLQFKNISTQKVTISEEVQKHIFYPQPIAYRRFGLVSSSLLPPGVVISFLPLGKLGHRPSNNCFPPSEDNCLFILSNFTFYGSKKALFSLKAHFGYEK